MLMRSTGSTSIRYTRRRDVGMMKGSDEGIKNGITKNRKLKLKRLYYFMNSSLLQLYKKKQLPKYKQYLNLLNDGVYSMGNVQVLGFR